MLTIFTIPKAFTGHIDVIQRNAIRSWTLLEPRCQVILVGDDEGTSEAARDLGVKNIPNVKRNEYGTPLLDSAFDLAEAGSSYPLMCHINADIILMNDFMVAVKRLEERSNRFLMTAQRWDLDIDTLLDYGNGWEDGLLKHLSEKGKLSHATGIDFWVYSKGLLDNMPPFAVGRIATESWLLYKTRIKNADLIDSTSAILSIHQNHDYTHHPEGLIGVGTGVEAQRNRELVGGKPYFFTIRDRTHVLTPKELKRARDVWKIWRTLRTSLVLHPGMPIPVKFASILFNGIIDVVRDLIIKVKRLTFQKILG